MSEPPDFCEYEDHVGSDAVSRWNAYFSFLFQEFCRTMIHGGVTFRGEKVSCPRHPDIEGKHKVFWHVTHKNKPGERVEDHRDPCFDRCRRIRWISWMIENADADPNIRVFPQPSRHGEKEPWALWHPVLDYLVILAKRNNYYVLITAYYPLRSGKVKELERDWKELNPTA